MDLEYFPDFIGLQQAIQYLIFEYPIGYSNFERGVVEIRVIFKYKC